MNRAVRLKLEMGRYGTMTVDEVVQLVLLAKYDKLPARVAQVVVAKLRELETALDRAQARIRELEVGREQR